MPTLEISHRDLCGLVGKNMNIDDIKEAILFAKAEVEEHSGDLIKVDSKDTNRPDLWSTEGIAREIRGRIVSGGLPKYEIKKSGITIKIDKKLKHTRPYTVGAVIKDLEIDEDVLSQMIQLQEKVSITFGKNRREVAIGAYDLHKIKPPIKFTTVKPDGVSFIPLEFKEKLTPKQILDKHPKGKEYRHLLEGFKEYPIFIDSAGEVLSLPPIINSEHTGKITKFTKDIFIECSGFDLKFLVPALNVIVTALADRGGKIESVDVIYPDGKIITPDLAPKEFTVDADYVNKVSGLNLKPKEICKLLEQARYEIKKHGKRIKVLYPAYRQDIMHPRDVIEDVIISYGYNQIEPKSPKLVTVGSQSPKEDVSNQAANIMVGMGFQEILSYVLTNKDSIFTKMKIPVKHVVEIENKVSSNWCVFRNTLIPGLLEFLSKNKHREYPQNIFEIGDVVLLDETKETKTRDIRKLAAAMISNSVGYEELSSILDAFTANMGTECKLTRATHPSFIRGRCANISVKNKKVGIIGEIHPAVLNNWGIEKSVVVMELNLEKL